jgi:hypothetical protein
LRVCSDRRQGRRGRRGTAGLGRLWPDRDCAPTEAVFLTKAVSANIPDQYKEQATTRAKARYVAIGKAAGIENFTDASTIPDQATYEKGVKALPPQTGGRGSGFGGFGGKGSGFGGFGGRGSGFGGFGGRGSGFGGFGGKGSGFGGFGGRGSGFGGMRGAKGTST